MTKLLGGLCINLFLCLFLHAQQFSAKQEWAPWRKKGNGSSFEQLIYNMGLCVQAFLLFKWYVFMYSRFLTEGTKDDYVELGLGVFCFAATCIKKCEWLAEIVKGGFYVNETRHGVKRSLCKTSF